MRQIGSQTRETLKESGYRLFTRGDRQVILINPESGKYELWFCNDHAASYVIQVGRWGYEFAHEYEA